jgi:hypothetical protein
MNRTEIPELGQDMTAFVLEEVAGIFSIGTGSRLHLQPEQSTPSNLQAMFLWGNFFGGIRAFEILQKCIFSLFPMTVVVPHSFERIRVLAGQHWRAHFTFSLKVL